MEKTKHLKKNWLNWENHDWQEYLDKKLDERKRVFLISPDDLVGSFNREKSHARDYHGRELLELIQNADDSGIDYSGKSKLLIRLTDYGLLVANTGIPFSPEGVASLMVSDNSPKQFLRTKCIGYKGLGFRSVLGWTSSVVILSGNLSIGFNEKVAINWLKGLRKESSKVDAKVKQFEDRGIKNPIATLSIPYFSHSGDEFGNQKLKKLYKEARKIQADGYDTAVCLLFKNPEKTKFQVQEQINSLSSEILLFLQFLERIEIETSEWKKSWLVERKKNQIIVNPKTQDVKMWKIFSNEGVIPPKILRPEQVLNNKYEIKIAIPEEPVDVNKLFVFFPTEVRFPFPLVAHATFEVGDNRQHLIDSEVNRFIAEKLADLMVKTAESIKDYSTPWHALSMVSPREDIDTVLEKFHFLDLLEDKIRKHKLLPVRNSHFEVAAKTKRIKGDFDVLLTGETFSDLCLYTDDFAVSEQLSKLEVGFIRYDDLRKRLNKISDGLSLDSRADLIFALIDNDLVEDVPPELLIDEDGNRISSGSSVFLPPEKKIFTLPSWVSQKVLSSEFTAKLKDRFRVDRIRDLSHKLESFKVQEYNMNALVSAISAETNRRTKDSPQGELDLRKEMVQAIWNLYSSSTEKVKLREEITIILPTRSGKFDSAKSLYLGNEYSGGKILEYFYAHIDSGLFVADVEKLGLSGVTQEIEDFLCWLGVNKTPRYTEINSHYDYDVFLDHVRVSLNYPVRFGKDIIIANAEELNGCSLSLNKVRCVDSFEKILSTADPHAVICWIATCPDIESWRVDGDTGASFEIKRPHQQHYRTLSNQYIPSYVLWLLRTVKWLPTSGGNKLAPSKCSLARGARDLEPIIGYPAIDTEHPLIKALNLDSTAIKNALSNIGVVTDLNELSWDSFYEVLLGLPELDPKGNKAKSLYRVLLGRSDADVVPGGKRYEEFMSEGKMLGRAKGKLSYYPISKLYYIDNITLPSSITEDFPLLELDKRRGATKVRKLFGVEQLTRDSIKIDVVDFEEHNASQSFQSDFERLKPYIYALRVEEDTNKANLSSLRRLKIKLCKSVKVAYERGGEKRETNLGESDSVSIDTVAYLVSKPSDYTRSFLYDEIIADALGEIISNIMKVDVNNEIARMASCSSNKRGLLLDRIVGGSGKERMERVRELLKAPEEKEDKEVFSKPSPWTPPPKEDEETPTKKSEDETVAEKPKPAEVGSVSAKDLGTPPSLRDKKVVARRIQGNPKIPHIKKQANPDRAENLAMRFEESQGRFAVKVSHIRGSGTYGCDIISFKSEEDSLLFKEKNDPDIVERFIEVKGSINEKGSITLAGNELNSAQTYREKFFLYRIYENEETGLFELIALSDPLGTEKEAFEIRYEINPFRTSKSNLWEVEEKGDL